MPLPPIKNLKSIGRFLLAFGLILYAVWRTSSGLESQMDIRFYDESFYLTQGLFHPISSWIADYSALYSLYYKAFSSIFTSEPIDLYYQNYRFWACELALVVFVVMRFSGVNYWFSLFWALSSLSSELNYPLWPKAGHLAMFGVTLGLFCVYKLKKRPFEAAFCCTGICFALAWCRPEFFLGGVFGVIYSGFLFLKNGLKPTLNVLIILPFILSILFMLIWDLPVGNSGRGLVAFGQHYVYNLASHVSSSKGDVEMDWINWRERFAPDFGNSNSIFAALFHNPAAFFSHIWINAQAIFYRCFVYFFETLIPNRSLGIPISGTIAVLGFGLESLHHFNGVSGWWVKRKDQIKSFLPFLFILTIPSFTAGFVFLPRPHYLLPLFPVFLFCIGSILSEFTFPFIQKRYVSWFGMASIAILCAFLPDASAFFRSKKNASNQSQARSSFNNFEPIVSDGTPNKILVKNLLKINWPQGTRIFDASTGATEYVGARVQQVGKIGFELNYPMLIDFNKFLIKHKIDVVFIRKSVYKDRFFAKQKSWQTFRSNPKSMGWRKEAVGQDGDSLFFKLKQ